ncbi:hypothetical protein CTAM01_10334 [Colletotrichum tamarilloi]|uniref:Patatin-like phospholipase n=1 Tax=Colletotrichum tamarilloi TaxID=1209934 RepID=A0ABQ9R0J1_9PEZI|nr:uncharacterized protein CTAM01_10334 [Colletotrichum tamarilloi]KAK1491219.1 hypothetical protein CTAM01_10334 [Colletotrichum tamarilloi]
MLIDRLAMLDRGAKYPSPVTSSNNDRLPTTGDVHLYADPMSYNTQAPVLYADCEGLDGGEAVPAGLRHRTKGKEEALGILNDVTNVMGKTGLGRSPKPSTASRSSGVIDTSSKRKFGKSRYASQRDLEWAVTPETKKREYAVTQLYPRLLYTFSDVVVFVLRNPRAFESTVLDKLLEWGSASIDKSLNQPALPHAVIVLNATDNVDDDEWNIETATARLLDDISGAIFREPRFEEQARLWQAIGRTINTTKDLLDCYYASITVIRVPSRGRYMLMDDQMGKLFELINKRCQASLLTKKRVRMLATADKLQVYLHAAYDHFSRDLDTPFDFVKEALKHNPIPQDFSGNILNLAISIGNNSTKISQNGGGTQQIFENMVPMISSCIMLDSVRQNILGTPVRLLDDAYVDFCNVALEGYADFYAPCTFSHPKYGKCYNVKFGHDPKGHQNKHGRIFAAGNYQSDVDLQDFAGQWIDQIRNHLRQLHARFQEATSRVREQSEQKVAADLHRYQLNDFYFSLGNVGDFISHSTCFSCLRELPEHPLPCGHVLCLPCIQAYGIKAHTTVEMKRCPLHERETMWEPAWTVVVKPQFAGARVLCLDGYDAPSAAILPEIKLCSLADVSYSGGVRGIVELHVLRAIERVFGERLPIQLFFDLIVGTSTGGIIALGLGVNNWSVEECIKTFKHLCADAFRPRELSGIPLLEKLVTINHGSIYKTKPFEALLREKFQDRPLFGGANDHSQSEMLTKVAVTSTTSIDQHSVILTNYNRPDSMDDELPYRLFRSNEPSQEFKAWEAARATSAAPPFFKSFTKADTKSSYLDGALYHNCPVLVAHHERRMIWPDIADTVPDILLSIGTGINGLDNEIQSTAHRTEILKGGETVTKRKRTFLPVQLAQIAADRFDRILSCNAIWSDFKTDILSQNSHVTRDSHRRHIRVNPDLRFKIPRLDAVNELDSLERATKRYLNLNRGKIKEIAHRLVASCFFFEKDVGSVRQVKEGFECTGRIHCRFANSSNEMKYLGEFLRTCLRGDFEPYFVVEEAGTLPDDASKIPMPEANITDMYLRGTFKLKRIRVVVSKELSTTNIFLCLRTELYPHSSNAFLPISGFPREMMSEDSQRKTQTPRSNKLLKSVAELRKANTQRYKSMRERTGAVSGLHDHLHDSSSSLSTKSRASGDSNRSAPMTPSDVGKWSAAKDELLSPEKFIFELEA